MPERHTVEEVRADQVREGDELVHWGSFHRVVDIEITGMRETSHVAIRLDGLVARWNMSADQTLFRRCPPVSEEGLAEWLVSLDDLDSQARRTVTLTQIIERAREVLTAARTTEGRR